MPKRIKRITMYRVDEPSLAADQGVLQCLVTKDIVSVRKNGTVAVYPSALEEDLDRGERRLVRRLLGFESADPEQGETLIVRRPGFVEGRAVIAGTRVPVWRVWRWLQQGAPLTGLRQQYGLSDEQIEAAVQYAEAHEPEMRRDIFDAERADEALVGVTR